MLSLAIAGTVAGGVAVPPAEANLPTSSGVKNANALLRLALPINNKPIRQIQASLEQISDDLRIPGKKPLGPIKGRVNKALAVLDKQQAAIAADFAPDKKAAGDAAIDGLRAALKEFQDVIAAENKDRVVETQQKALSYVSEIEESMMNGMPFQVPADYAALPQLQVRAGRRATGRCPAPPPGPPPPAPPSLPPPTHAHPPHAPPAPRRAAPTSR